MYGEEESEGTAELTYGEGEAAQLSEQQEEGETYSAEELEEAAEEQRMNQQLKQLRIKKGYRTIYDTCFQKEGYSFTEDYDAKGNSRAILKEDETSIEYLVYDRESQNGLCGLYVYYRAPRAADGSWSPMDAEILDMLDIPSCMLPEVRPSSEVYGTAEPCHFGAPIPIAGAAGDQQAALFGQTCFQPGEAKNTYGTGCFLLMNVGDKPVRSRHGLVTTIAWGLGGKVQYALEGSVFVAGAAIQWLRDEMHLLESAADSEYLAKQVPDTHGCYVVPAFTGLGAPHWDAYARGTIVGLTRGVNRCHIVRATLDALAYQTADVLQAMRADSGVALSALKVDGGASANHYLMQAQADIGGLPVLRPRCVETTAMGAAYLAGLAVGVWRDPEEVLQNWEIDRIFQPEITAEERQRRIAGWNRAVQCSRNWAREEEAWMQ